MIPKVGRGEKMGGLMVYLLGPGKHNEHTDRHVIAGSVTVMRDQFLTHFGAGDDEVSREVALQLAKELDLPRTIHETRVRMRAKPRGARGPRVDVVERPEPGEESVLRDAPVWHCVLSLNPDEELTDAQWSDVVHDFMDRLGFKASDGKPGARWAAVRHGRSGAEGDGNDHIHIAASLVREDGSKVSTFDYGPGKARGDFARAQEVCTELEHKYGLRVLESREKGAGMPGLSRAELERAKRRGMEPERETLRLIVRECAVASVDEAEFVRRLRSCGVQAIPRYATGGQAVSGYSVRMRPEPGAEAGVPIGGKNLSGDLSLPQLRLEWNNTPEAQAAALAEWRGEKTRPGREAVQISKPDLATRAARDMADWTATLAAIPLGDHARWAREAGRAAGVIAGWSRRTESGTGPKPLADAAKALARSAQIPARQRWRPPADRSGHRSLSGAAVILSQWKTKDKEPAAAWAHTLGELMKAIQAMADAHQARNELQQATRLRAAAEDRLAGLHARYQRAVEDPHARTAAAEAVSLARQGTEQAPSQLRPRKGKPGTPGRGVPLPSPVQQPGHDKPGRGR